MALTATSTLILGQTGSGKSTFAKSVAKASSLPTYVINGQEKDFNPEHGFKHITFDELIQDQEEEDEDEREITNCILIIDDIVRPSDIQAKCINKQLVHKKRHDNITTFALSHGIERNNLHSLIKHFDFIMFTHKTTNNPIFKSYAKKYCPMSLKDCLTKWEDFISNEDSKSYFRFNNSTAQFDVIDVQGNILSNTDNEVRKKVFKYLLSFGEPKIAMALFDYLIDVLPAGYITKNSQSSTDSKN